MAKRLPAYLRDPDYFKKQGAKGGKIGGTRTAANRTPAERTASALKASKAAAVVRSAKKKAKG